MLFPHRPRTSPPVYVWLLGLHAVHKVSSHRGLVRLSGDAMELYDYAVICLVLIVAVMAGGGLSAIILACINDIVLAESVDPDEHADYWRREG